VSKLTSRQADLLGIVGANGPPAARDIGEYHLPIGASSARAALATLERKGFVTPNYTCRVAIDQRAHAYTLTQDGSDALASALRDLEDSDTFPRARYPGRGASQRGGGGGRLRGTGFTAEA
jgi:hypothetical protein